MFLPYEAPDGADFFREKYTYVCIISLLCVYIVYMSYRICRIRILLYYIHTLSIYLIGFIYILITF